MGNFFPARVISSGWEKIQRAHQPGRLYQDAELEIQQSSREWMTYISFTLKWSSIVPRLFCCVTARDFFARPYGQYLKETKRPQWAIAAQPYPLLSS
ncbi:hypothetical protein PENSTE_c002G01727 [Penicillium steckii]|uniref:Uncharacterized protein n=1 Tax=Penicillium steckii TaxID=303698 RepID=A0A1V6TV43_9EURO|nr:hypothetical protein PENSTE_c002G01727 [Penicillium steckii]